jgi:hypothetical protein
VHVCVCVCVCMCVCVFAVHEGERYHSRSQDTLKVECLVDVGAATHGVVAAEKVAAHPVA